MLERATVWTASAAAAARRARERAGRARAETCTPRPARAGGRCWSSRRARARATRAPASGCACCRASRPGPSPRRDSRPAATTCAPPWARPARPARPSCCPRRTTTPPSCGWVPAPPRPACGPCKRSGRARQGRRAAQPLRGAQDMLLLAQHGALARAAEQLPAFRDALLLLKVRPAAPMRRVRGVREGAGGRSRSSRRALTGARRAGSRCGRASRAPSMSPTASTAPCSRCWPRTSSTLARWCAPGAAAGPGCMQAARQGLVTGRGRVGGGALRAGGHALHVPCCCRTHASSARAHRSTALAPWRPRLRSASALRHRDAARRPRAGARHERAAGNARRAGGPGRARHVSPRRVHGAPRGRRAAAAAAAQGLPRRVRGGVCGRVRLAQHGRARVGQRARAGAPAAPAAWARLRPCLATLPAPPRCLLGLPASCRRSSSLLQHRFELARGEETGRAPDARRRGAQAQAAAARSVALLDRPRAPLDAFRAVFLARQPRGAAFDAWWHVHVPAPGGPALGGDVPAWRCAPDTPPGEARSGRRRLQDLAQAAAARNAARACRVRAARRL